MAALAALALQTATAGAILAATGAILALQAARVTRAVALYSATTEPALSFHR